MVQHSYNPSYSGGRRIPSLKGQSEQLSETLAQNNFKKWLGMQLSAPKVQSPVQGECGERGEKEQANSL